MRHRNRSPRRRVNRFVLMLSKIYEVSYKVVHSMYTFFNESIELTKRKLEQIARAEAELSTIDSINLLF